jgi:DNA-binding NarL/FixJ family response regulator
MPIKVAIVEDDPEIGEGLKTMIESSPDLYCIGLYENAELFKSKFKYLAVDVVLMDIKLPGSSGIDCVEELKELRPNVQFLMCTNLEDSEKVFSALSVGATGYIVKNTSSDNLIIAIKEIFMGGSPMTPQIARKVAETFKRERQNKYIINSLSVREIKILELLAAGYPYKLIALEINRSIETVRTNIRDIYTKLQVHNRTEAVNKFYKK